MKRRAREKGLISIYIFFSMLLSERYDKIFSFVGDGDVESEFVLRCTNVGRNLLPSIISGHQITTFTSDKIRGTFTD